MNKGTIVGVNGSVIIANFEKNLPKIFSKLVSGDVIAEVLEQMEGNRVKAVALNSTVCLICGDEIIDTEKEIEIPVGD